MKLILFTGAAMLLGGFFQLPSTPPGKAGLWETSSTAQMNMPGMNVPPRTVKVHTCNTAGEWQKNLGNPPGQDCSKTGESFSGSTYTAQISCKSGTKGTITMTWDTPESSHGTMHLDMNTNGRSMSMDMSMTSHFVSADCGAVKPGTGVPVL